MRKNLKQLLENEKSVNRILEWYQEFMQECGETAFDDIKNDILSFITEDEILYDDFYEYAMKNYYPTMCTDGYHISTHKIFTENQNEYKMMPIGYRCILYYVYLYTERQKLESLATLTIDEQAILDSMIYQFRVLGEFMEEIDEYVKGVNNVLFLNDMKRLDENVRGLDNSQKRYRFLKAIKNGQIKTAMRILYRIDDMLEDEEAYYEAIMALMDKDYNEGIYRAKLVNKSSKYYFKTLNVLLECYAMQGDYFNFVQCLLQNREYTYDLWNIIYLRMLLALNAKDLNAFETMYASLDNQIEVTDEKTNYYGSVVSLVSKICLEGFEILDEILSLAAMDSSFTVSNRISHRLQQLSVATKSFSKSLAESFSVQYYMINDFKATKDRVINYLGNIFVTESPNHSFEDLKSLTTMFLKLGHEDLFLMTVSKNFDTIVAHAEDGNHDAEEILRYAYIEGTLQNNVDQRVVNYVLPQVNELTKDVKAMKAYAVLSDAGKRAFEFAEWEFKKSQEEEYGCKDAGMLSLAYYRIFELELNRYIVYPLAKQVQYANVYAQFETYRNSLSNPARSSYIKKWSSLLDSIKTMENSQYTEGALMLGPLDKLFRNINIQDRRNANDPLSILFDSLLTNIFTTHGMSQWNGNFFSDITIKSNREKYRNPPAHTKYLAYDVACECRDFYIDKMSQIEGLFK